MAPMWLIVSMVFTLSLSGRKYNEYHHRSVTLEGRVIDSILEANEPTICDPNVQQYSGYLNAGGTNNKYFYWFFESRSNPSKDPLIMWLTGLSAHNIRPKLIHIMYNYIYIVKVDQVVHHN